MPPILVDLFNLRVGSDASDPRIAMAVLFAMFGVAAVFTVFFLVMRTAGRFRSAAPRALGETAVVGAVFSIAILVWTDRLSSAWLLYMLPFPVLAVGYALWERFGPRRAGNAAVSRFGTRYLKVVLDHGKGVLDGEVIRGSYRGSVLSSMTREALRLLRVEVSSDPESVHVLNTYLDYTDAGADHDEPARGGNTGQRANGAMNEEEAWNLLGLTRGSSADQIKESHRRLIKQVHPDHGGTDYLAHKINEAKSLLLNL